MPVKKAVSIKLILILYLITMFLNSCTQHDYKYGFTESAAISSDGRSIAVLAAETEVTTKQVNGGYRSSTNNTTYWLKLYELPSGKFLKKKLITENAEKQNITVLSYGGYGDNIWIHSNKMEVYNINTLEKVADEVSISEQNQADPFNFPIDQRFIDEMLSDGYMLYRGMDSKQYKIDAGNFKITMLDKLTPEQISIRNRKITESTQQQKIRGFRTDTISNNMYMLAKDNATAKDINPGNESADDIFSSLHFYKAEYSVSKFGSYHSYQKENLAQQPGNSYYNGRFLKDYNSGRIIKTDNGNGYLIISLEKPTNETATILSSVDTGNKIIWQTNTGLSSRINHCFANKNYCVITGNKHYIISPPVGSNMISIIDLKNGKLTTLMPDE